VLPHQAGLKQWPGEHPYGRLNSALHPVHMDSATLSCGNGYPLVVKDGWNTSFLWEPHLQTIGEWGIIKHFGGYIPSSISRGTPKNKRQTGHDSF